MDPLVNATTNATIIGTGEIPGFIEKVSEYGTVGLFLASFISNLIPGFPAVYLALVATYTAIVDNMYYNIVALILSGVGAGLGKVLVFLISNFLGSRSKRIQNIREGQAKWLIEKAGKNILLTVFIFAALPLPDDILYIPLGVAGYHILPFMIAVILGKIVLTGIAVFIGRIYRSVFDLMAGGTATSVSLELLIIGALAGSIILSYVVLTMDWKKLYDVYKSKGAIKALIAFIVEFFITLFRPLIIIINIIYKRNKT
ncbi:MAG: VTT domain-containing protein [Desulfurococcales archaeon]|nr:VTT domain-containing protein [Desulfurococcales archaeon]